MPDDKPLVLKLAPLPRLQVGPFLILGVNKDASKETIEASWAQRLIWARKDQTAVPLEDINWAREIISDPERRTRADAMSLNVDTTDGVLKRLKERFQGQAKEVAGCQPIDLEKSVRDYAPPIAIPDLAEIRQTVPLPEVPKDVPAVRRILEQEGLKAMNPWDFEWKEEM